MSAKAAVRRKRSSTAMASTNVMSKDSKEPVLGRSGKSCRWDFRGRNYRVEKKAQ